MNAYNYQRFSPDHYDFTRFEHPEVGGPAPDFTAHDLDGNPVRFSGLAGQPIALEMGSVTCPVYAGLVRRMGQLAEQFPSVRFVVLYVREAHPGERRSAHRDLEEKIDRARQLRALYGEHRTILVDDVDGNAHARYGGFPNSLYLIDEQHRIFWFSQWNHPEETAENLRRLVDGQPGGAVSLSQQPGGHTFSALLKGGWLAVWDFLVAFPRLIWYKFLKKS